MFSQAPPCRYNEDQVQDTLSSVQQPGSMSLDSSVEPELSEFNNEEDEQENEEHDLRTFASLFDRYGIVAQVMRRGEKDFEAHGTRQQEAVLEASRRVLEDVLAETRFQNEKSWMRGWYFPNYWESMLPPSQDVEVDESTSDSGDGDKGTLGVESCDGETTRALVKARMQRRAARHQRKAREQMLIRERVVVADNLGSANKSIGRAVAGQDADAPTLGREWLLPEEALLLVDRGVLDLWYPTAEMDAVFPSRTLGKQEPRSLDNYELGFPLTQEAAYALFIGDYSERGKVTLEQFQVYANLKRAGYIVTRAPQDFCSPSSGEHTQGESFSILGWITSVVTRVIQKPTTASRNALLVQPGLHRSYRSIYEKLAIIPRYTPTIHQVRNTKRAQDPYKVFYFVWKGGRASFSKSNPPPPDFYVAVVNARTTCMPTIEQISSLLHTMPWNPPGEKCGLNYKIKHGYRRVILAAVDQGVINYYRFDESSFAQHLLFPSFDLRSSSGLRGGQPKRQGRGGRGRGRGDARGGRGGRGSICGGN